MNKLNLLIEFFDEISLSEQLKTTEKGRSTIDKLKQKLVKKPGLLYDFVDDFINDYHVQLNKEDAYILFLCSYRFEWSRPENFTKEGYLEGGLAFNGLEDIYMTNPPFWKNTTDDLEKYEQRIKPDYELLKNLRWVESSHHFLNSTSGTLPFAGCCQLNQDEMPDKFYFFDGGIVFNLPFHSYGEYIDALAASGAVNCWQYFFISPEELIGKNKGVNYMTWTQKTSDLDERLNRLTFHENMTYDRLDLLAEYLERCVRLLPTTFPLLDFSHHQKQYTTFKELYDGLNY